MDNPTICIKFAAYPSIKRNNMPRIKEGFSGERAFVLPPACVRELERHPLSQILHITDIGYYPNALNHFRQREMPIDQYVFIYCVDGNGWYSVDGKRHPVSADTYFILPPGKPHSYGADAENPWTIYWIHFNGNLAPYYLPSGCCPIPIKPGVTSRIADRLDIFEEIMSTLENGFETENLLYACSIFHHFLGSLRFVGRYRSTKFHDRTRGNGTSDIVEAAIHFMNENINKKLRTESIASYVGYSATQFTLLFTKKIGVSPIAYFNQLKVKVACRLLVESDLKVNQICHKVGIKDQYYFSRMFAKAMGIPPTQYRCSLLDKKPFHKL